VDSKKGKEKEKDKGGEKTVKKQKKRKKGGEKRKKGGKVKG